MSTVSEKIQLLNLYLANLPDGLKWLDDGLPDLSGATFHRFDLETEFDIQRYLNILSDSISDKSTTAGENSGGRAEAGKAAVPKSAPVHAETVVPSADEWGAWGAAV